MKQKQDKVVETAPIRLTADETRSVMKAAAAGGKPIDAYQCCGLVDLGIMKRVYFPTPDVSKEVLEQWRACKEACLNKDADKIGKIMHKISELEYKTRKKTGYVLTELGQRVARGVSVRLNSQFTRESC